MPANSNDKEQKERIRELFSLFLKLGLTGFGGPAVHLAMMEEEVVRKRQWMDRQHFLDLIGATNLIPGPNSTEMAMHIGQERAGRKGLLVAGACFILPAVVITAVFAFFYQLYGSLPQVQPFLAGIKPAIVSVIAALMFDLGKKAVKNTALAVTGLLAAAAVLLGMNEIAVLFAAGLIGMLMQAISPANWLNSFLPFTLLQIKLIDVPPSTWKLFWIFLKVGAILYGSGYVLFAFLDVELVSRGWISKQQLADAIAVGQFTPGPVFSSATFIGWQIGGRAGATAATIGIFLPSFLFVALLNPLIPKLRRSPLMSAFLDFVNVASVAIILSVLVEIVRSSPVDWRFLLIAALGFFVTFHYRRLNTAWTILGGAVLGYLLWLV